ncbi:MAG: hypothetical protein LBG52_01550 [Candidatus Peribacteria bacterium]|jgi:hypothetical protein|nr:hypothetical protein [Candidatus Peribacteria bacterium]
MLYEQRLLFPQALSMYDEALKYKKDKVILTSKLALVKKLHKPKKVIDAISKAIEQLS